MTLRVRNFYLFLAFFSLLQAPGTPLWSAFEDNETGARAAALGGAYVALGDDTASLFYNPANLSLLHRAEIASEYSRFFTGLSDGSNLGQIFFGYAQPLGNQGTLAFGWKQWSLDNLYLERTLALGYGREMTRRLSAGFTVKQLHESFGEQSIVVDDAGSIQSGTPALFAANGTSVNAYAADLGLLYRLTPRYRLGASVQNVNQPNVALSPSDSDVVPRTLRLGLAYKNPDQWAWTSALDAVGGMSGETQYKAKEGVEKWWTAPGAGDWVARGGLVLGNQELRQISTGFGYRFRDLELDYAFVFGLSGITLDDNTGTHRFSLTYRLDPFRKLAAPTPPEEIPPMLSISSSSVQGLMPFTLDVSSNTISPGSGD